MGMFVAILALEAWPMMTLLSRAGGLMVHAADSAERFIVMYAHLDGC
jgi:hypothetical protein